MKTIAKTMISAFSLPVLLVVSVGVCALVPMALAGPAAQKSKAETTPAAVQGRWIATETSASSDEDDNGRSLGAGSGNAQISKFDGHGGYHHYMQMEVRTYSFVTRARNSCEGTVTFSGDTLSLHPTTGHYHVESGGHVTDRPMNAEDLGRVTKTYHWRV